MVLLRSAFGVWPSCPFLRPDRPSARARARAPIREIESLGNGEANRARPFVQKEKGVSNEALK